MAEEVVPKIRFSGSRLDGTRTERRQKQIANRSNHCGAWKNPATRRHSSGFHRMPRHDKGKTDLAPVGALTNPTMSWHSSGFHRMSGHDRGKTDLVYRIYRQFGSNLRDLATDLSVWPNKTVKSLAGAKRRVRVVTFVLEDRFDA